MTTPATFPAQMPPPSPALEMHQAAARLRHAAEAMLTEMQVRPDEWRGTWASEMDGALGGPSGVLAGLFSPPAANALADWLDRTAAGLVRTTHPGWQATVEPEALAIARHINATA